MLGFDVYVPHPIGVGTSVGKVFQRVAIEVYSPDTMPQPLSPCETFFTFSDGASRVPHV